MRCCVNDKIYFEFKKAEPGVFNAKEVKVWIFYCPKEKSF